MDRFGKYSWIKEEQLKKIKDKLISIGEPAVPLLLEILKDKENKSWQKRKTAK